MDIRTQRLNEAVRASGMTQAEICRKTGINQGALSSYLCGRYYPKQKALEELSSVLKVPIPFLMGYDVPEYSGTSSDAKAITESSLLSKIKRLSKSDLALLDKIIDAILEINC